MLTNKYFIIHSYLYLSYKFFMQNKNIQTGGDNHMSKLLEKMIDNDGMTDQQKLNQLNEKKKNNEDIVKKIIYTIIY